MKSAKKTMTLNDYQQRAMTTCMDSCDNFAYMFINLVGELGEFASKVAKQVRKENAGIGSYGEENDIVYKTEMTLEDALHLDNELKKEAGDILWQLAGLCKVMSWELDDVARLNLEKLAARKAAGTIDGSGDGVYDRKP